MYLSSDQAVLENGWMDVFIFFVDQYKINKSVQTILE